MLIDVKLENYLEIGKKAAKAAGNFLLNYSKENLEILKNDGKDIKISADKEAEKIIVDILSEETDISLLCEESGLVGENNSEELKWIVDPLDGSLNFSRNLPNCCVSIALWKDKEPVLGAVYDFNRNELFSGIVGQGAWLNNENIKVSNIQDLGKSIIATGFPSQTDFSQEALLNFVNKVRKFKKVRLLGTAALSLAYVACGRVDAYSEKDIKIWDIAAGVAVVLAAGGKIEYMNDTKENAVDILVNNSKLNF